MLAIALLLFADVRPELVATDSVSHIESNAVYEAPVDCKGVATIRHVFTQLIFRDTYTRDKDPGIVAWRMHSHGGSTKHEFQGIHRHRDSGGEFLLWHDGERLRKVYYQTWSDTVSDWDVELVEREGRPNVWRRELR